MTTQVTIPLVIYILFSMILFLFKPQVSKKLLGSYFIIIEIVRLSVCNRNYITTQVKIPLVIYVTFSMILFLFKPQLLIKFFYIINTVGHICRYLPLIPLMRAGHKVSFLCGTTHKPRLMGGRWEKLRRSRRHSPSRGCLRRWAINPALPL